MVWVGFFVLVLLLLVSLLWIPILLTIDTDTGQYDLRLKGLAKASVEPHEEEILRVAISVLFVRFYVYPVAKIRAYRDQKQLKASKPSIKKKPKRQRTIKYKQLIRLLKTFSVQRFLLDIDTGDCITNAQWYPAFALLNHQLGGFYINFQGRNRLILQVKNRPIHLITTFIHLKK